MKYQDLGKGRGTLPCSVQVVALGEKLIMDLPTPLR